MLRAFQDLLLTTPAQGVGLNTTSRCGATLDIHNLHMVTEERIRVRYGETDQMGHAYYANYLYWFEQARGAFCRDRGFSYKQLEEMGFMLPVVEVYARYKGEVKYDDIVIVKVWIEEIKRAAVQFKYEVLNDTLGKVTTEGYTWHVMMGEKRKAITIPPHIREMMERNPSGSS